jgi:catechol 2,3-dioxygenase-like lactoylglutathione lyase family enzyme
MQRDGIGWLVLGALAACAPAPAPSEAQPEPPRLHHVGLNSIDPDAAIDWYLRVWPTARRTEVAGMPGVEADIFLLFERVDSPPAGAWNDDLHRSDPQSAFWHIGAFTNTTDMAERLRAVGVAHLPLFTSPADRTGVWRSGLAPYRGTLTAAQLDTASAAPPRDGGFSYVVAPDGVLFEFTGGPDTRDSFSHVHFFREAPLCTANWYVEQLGMTLPPLRDADGRETARPPWDPCDGERGEAGWPSLEPIGTIRQPSGSVRFGNGTMSWYPRQCTTARCGSDAPLARSRGQALDHVAFTVHGLDAWYARLRGAGITILEEPYPFGDTRAFMIEDPDGLAVELIEHDGARLPPSETSR